MLAVSLPPVVLAANRLPEKGKDGAGDRHAQGRVRNTSFPYWAFRVTERPVGQEGPESQTASGCGALWSVRRACPAARGAYTCW